MTGEQLFPYITCIYTLDICILLSTIVYSTSFELSNSAKLNSNKIYPLDSKHKY
jgi:hypothetical protein